MATPKELARIERQKQLAAYEAFERGESVVFRTHYGREGFRLSKTDLPQRPSKGKLLHFTLLDSLIDAAMTGDTEQIEDLISKKGVDPNVKDADGVTALHRASVENSLPAVSLLLSKGANVNIQDNDGWTPLHSACYTGNWRIVNTLVASGADPAILNNDGDLPLDVSSDAKVENILVREMERLSLTESRIKEMREAAGKAMLKEMKTLVAKGSNLNTRHAHQATWLHIAACNGYTDVVAFLLEQPLVDVNLADDEGNTPLHLAVFWLQFDIVTLLIARGADVEARNRLHQKPIVLSEDEVMIRLITTLHQTASKGVSVSTAGHAGPPRSGSISRKSAEARRKQAKDDASHESSTIAASTNNSNDD